MPAFAWALLFTVASYALQSLTTKVQKPSKAGLSDFDFPQSEEGTPQAMYFGDVWTDSWQVVWYGNLRTKKIKSKGKK